MTNKKSHGKRKRTRSKFRRSAKHLTIAQLLRSFEVGTRVHIQLDSSVHSGLPDKRFVGLTGTITGKQGKNGVLVLINVGNALKQIIVHPAHLFAVSESKQSVIA